MPPKPPPDIDRRALLQGSAATLVTATATDGVTATAPDGLVQPPFWQHWMGDDLALGHPPTVELYLHKNEREPGLTYFAPHYSETTAPEAAQSIINKTGGKVGWLVHGDKKRKARNISFTIKGERFEFDPNRMFTEIGARKSLAMFSGTGPGSPVFDAAVHAVVDFASKVLHDDYLAPSASKGKILVGIHNNHGGYSLLSYQTGGEYGREIRKGGYFRSPNWDIGNFFYTTSEKFFNILKENNFSVVWQAEKPTDDGSLSVYCGQPHVGVDYVNVEARQGDRARQESMIQFLHDHIRSQT